VGEWGIVTVIETRSQDKKIYINNIINDVGGSKYKTKNFQENKIYKKFHWRNFREKRIHRIFAKLFSRENFNH